MKRRYTVVVGLAAVAVMAMVSSALGGPSLPELVKNEVAKQLDASAVTAKGKKKKAKKGPRGPAGPAGQAGVNGTNGTDGTARAYASVSSHFTNACSPNCTTTRAKGITAVTHPSIGVYCVAAAGISSLSVPSVVSADGGLTSAPEGNVLVMQRANAADCGPDQFQVITMRRPSASAANAAKADDVGFAILIP